MRKTVLEAPRTIAAKSEPSWWRRGLKILGPGLITGASDDDPSGIVTYTQAGAQFGFQTLWTALVTFPLMAVVQYICAKIGLISGQGLAGVLRKHFPRPVLFAAVSVLLVANIVNAAADLSAIGSCVNLLVPSIPAWFAILFASLSITALMLFGSYARLANILKWLSLSLLAYILAATFTHPSLSQVLQATFLPRIEWSQKYIAVLVAILGTTISPYLFFWQATQEVEEQRQAGRSIAQRKGATNDDLLYAGVDVFAGMLFSNVVMYFVIMAAGGAMHGRSEFKEISSAVEAAQALRPFAGDLATLFFAVGVISTGLLAIPVLIGSTAFALAETFGWRRGFDFSWSQARPFYLAIILSSLSAIILDMLNINPMQALFGTAVLNGLLAPPLLFLIMLISNDVSIMGEHTNSKLTNFAGWLTTALMVLAALVFAIVSFPVSSH